MCFHLASSACCNYGCCHLVFQPIGTLHVDTGQSVRLNEQLVAHLYQIISEDA